MAHEIIDIEKGSAAYKAGLKIGDMLVSINGEPVIDLIDFQYLTADNKLKLLVKRNNEELIFNIKKKDYESLGIELAQDKLLTIRNCANNCIFCFEDQLPPNARDSMRVKDDDWRLSLITGSFVTLTNVSDNEINRIIKRKASPLYISVHTTDGALREKMLGNKFASRILGQLNMLKDGNISFHTQAVLCPGVNDGEKLQQTIHDIVALYPAAQSLALVPVGLTKYRDGLYPVNSFTKEEAIKVLEIADWWRAYCKKNYDTVFVYPSDEFYILAGRELPKDEDYENYDQIDNGVGMVRAFKEDYLYVYNTDKPARKTTKTITLACGTLISSFFEDLLNKYPIQNADITVKPIVNNYFGSSVTVSGLVTGVDLINQLKSDTSECVIITRLMLKDDEDIFLDGLTLTEVSNALNKPVIPVERSGEDFINAILQL